jgi:outer membrane protein assembly factor BamB
MKAVGGLALLVVLGGAVAGCTSSSSAPSCSFADPPSFPPSASSWPKFHHDRQNTGRIDEVRNLPAPQSMPRWNFSAPGPGKFSAGPVLNQNDALIYIGSTDGSVYVVNAGDNCAAGTPANRFVLAQQFGINGTALVGLRDGKDAIFVGSEGGALFGVDADGLALLTNWPAGVVGGVSVSPNLSLINGIVYVGSMGGVFAAVCPNGIGEFSLPTSGFSSSPAVGPDGTVYFGADDGKLRAFDVDGRFKWAFSASASIVTAPVVEILSATGSGAGPTPITAAIYVADSGGEVFKVTSTGQVFRNCSPSTNVPCRSNNDCPSGEDCIPFDFVAQNGRPVGAIQSSPALAGDHLYFGSNDGNLYAVDTQSGAIAWRVFLFRSTEGIVSSPAVATKNLLQDRVVVIGAGDGNVYFVEDNGDTAGAPQVFNIGAPVRSAPAIDIDGTVYVGADDGHVYAIGAPLACGGTPTPVPSATPSPTP